MESEAVGRANELCRRHLDPMPGRNNELLRLHNISKNTIEKTNKKTNGVKNVIMLKAGGACGSRLTARINQSK